MEKEMKEFLEFISSQNIEVRDKVRQMDRAGVIAFAKENGFTLSDADFEPKAQEMEGEVSLKEADAIAGGGECYCVVGGGGSEETKHNRQGYETGDGECVCVAYGEGDKIYVDYHDGNRCVCVVGGYGESIVN